MQLLYLFLFFNLFHLLIVFHCSVCLFHLFILYIKFVSLFNLFSSFFYFVCLIYFFIISPLRFETPHPQLTNFSSSTIKSHITKFSWTHFISHFDSNNLCTSACCKCTSSIIIQNFHPGLWRRCHSRFVSVVFQVVPYIK